MHQTKVPPAASVTTFARPAPDLLGNPGAARFRGPELSANGVEKYDCVDATRKRRGRSGFRLDRPDQQVQDPHLGNHVIAHGELLAKCPYRYPVLVHVAFVAAHQL